MCAITRAAHSLFAHRHSQHAREADHPIAERAGKNACVAVRTRTNIRSAQTYISQWQSTEKPSRGKINYIPHPSVSLWVLQYTCARSPASRRTLPEFRDVTLLLLQQSTHTNFQSSLSPQKHASEALELLKENARMQKLTSDDACTHTPLTSAVYPRCSRKSLPFRRRWRRAAARRPPPSFRHRESPVCSEGVGGELNHFSTAPVFWGGLHEIRVDSFSQQ